MIKVRALDDRCIGDDVLGVLSNGVTWRSCGLSFWRSVASKLEIELFVTGWTRSGAMLRMK